MIFGSVASSIAHVKSGKLKALATTGTKRSKVAPELPTMQESGFPGFEVTTWYSFMVPAGTPHELAARIRTETKTWAEVIKAAGIKPE